MLRRVPVFVRYEGEGSTPRAQCAFVRRVAERMLDALALRSSELSILLCDDKTMHVLNFEHRHIDKPTDVLAFAQREGLPMVLATVAGQSLGDVAIALPTAARQAREHAWSERTEICLLLAHGVLHLLGFDHATRRQERRMSSRTHLLMAAGLGPGQPVDKASRHRLARAPSRRRHPSGMGKKRS
jgi:probable rRNA maturation factor